MTAGTTMSSGTTMTVVRALNSALRHSLEKDPKTLLMGEDIAELGGVFRVTDGLAKDFGSHRVFDSPLAESGIVGTAIGLAMRGFRPVVEIQFDGFVFPAFDQIVSQLAKTHRRTAGQVTLPITIRIPYGGGIGAVEHHSESPEALFAHIPGLRVLTAWDPQTAFTNLTAAIDSDDPVIFLEPKRRYWDKGEVDTNIEVHSHTEIHTVDPWKAHVVKPGTDVTIVAYGPMVRTALEAERASEFSGEVIDLSSISPLDDHTISESVKKTGRLVIVHEAPGNVGVGAEIAARIGRSCFYYLEAPIERVTGFDVPYPASKLEEHYLPGIDRVLYAVDTVMAEGRSAGEPA